MALNLKGVMQSPVTPLKADFSPDLQTFEKLLDFHVRTGATAISWPHHKGESLNLTIAERKAFAEVAVKVVAKRIPVSIHVSALAVEDSMELARHAQQIGADAIIAITPYFWHPTVESLYDYFVCLGTSIDLPLIAYNSPDYLAGLEFTGDLTRTPDRAAAEFHRHEGSELQQRKIPRDFARRARAAAGVLDDCRRGISAPSFRSAARDRTRRQAQSVPTCARRCTKHARPVRSVRARELQFKLARLWDLFRDQYPSSLKGGMVVMGRPVGQRARRFRPRAKSVRRTSRHTWANWASSIANLTGW